MIEGWKAKKGPRPIGVPEGTLCACGCGEALISKTIWDYRSRRLRAFNLGHHARRQKVDLTCLQCNRVYRVTPWEARRRKFCTKSCGSTYYQTGKRIAERISFELKYVACPVCDKVFELKKSEYESRRKITCSQECGQKISGSKRLGIGEAVSPATHRRQLVEVRPPAMCERCGFSEEVGILHMHHKDGNPRNGVISNLEWICPNCHMIDHFRNRTGPYSKTRGRGRRPPVGL